MSNALQFVAVDPRTGCHLRPATDAEATAYLVCNPAAPFDRAVLVGEVLIDTDAGSGSASLLCHDTACDLCPCEAEHRACADCGAEAVVVDCGHYDQPRPIAASAHAGGDAVCEACEAARR